MIIGQERLLNKIDTLIKVNFPRFLILVGPQGCGKKLISKYIADKLGFSLIPVGVGVDDVRTVIANSYSNSEPIVYIFADTDKMSVAGKNALLKVTEEPPQNSYFIMTVASLDNTLSTLTSRACVLNFDTYENEHLEQYLLSKYPDTNKDIVDFVKNITITPKQVDIVMSYDVKEFRRFVDKFYEEIGNIGAYSSFKFEDKLSLKKDDGKWDILLFLQTIKFYLATDFLEVTTINYFKALVRTNMTITELSTKNSVNKQYVLDQFVIEYRKCWRS